MTTTQTVPIELTRPGPPGVLYATAGDQYSRLAALPLYEGGAPYTPPAGTSCTIGWRRRATGAVGSYSLILLPDGSTRPAWTLSGNVLTIELDWQLCLQAGAVEVNVALTGPDGSRLHTWEMLCQVGRGAVAEASDPTAPNEAASTAADRAEEAARQAVQAANLMLDAADRAEAAADRAEAIAPEEGVVLSVNGQGGAVTLTAADVDALPAPASPTAGALLAVDTVPTGAGPSTKSVPVDGAHGVEVAAAGLQLTPATAQQLAAMAEQWDPVTPALLPLAVKLALASAWASAGWTDTDRANARATLGAADAAAMASQLADLTARVNALELSGGGGSSAVDQPYTADFAAMTGMTYTGVWNQVLQRLEF